MPSEVLHCCTEMLQCVALSSKIGCSLNCRKCDDANVETSRPDTGRTPDKDVCILVVGMKLKGEHDAHRFLYGGSTACVCVPTEWHHHL